MIGVGVTGLTIGILSVLLYLSIKRGNLQALEIQNLTEKLKLSSETNQKLFEQGTRLIKENKKLASDGLKKGSSIAGKVMQGYKAVG